MPNKICEDEDILIRSSNEETDDQRWLITSTRTMQERTNEKWNWFNTILNKNNSLVKINLGYDDFLQKPVIIKGYNCSQDNNFNSIEISEVIKEQLTILNKVQSPLFPEPLDWFENLYNRSPVLVLDWIPGITLDKYIKTNKLKFDNGETNYAKIARIAVRIVKFIKELKSKGYCYTALSPEHIILLKDDIPRFIGLSYICPIKKGVIDKEHINFKKFIYGYSAPELSYAESGMKIDYTADQINAYSLGVLLHQMIVNSNDFKVDNINNGAFTYPNGETEKILNDNYKGERWHQLISLLCDLEIENRLKDFDEIEYRLHELGGTLIKTHKPFTTRKEEVAGTIKWYDISNNFGYIKDNEGNEYSISSKVILNYNEDIEKKLVTGTRIKFDISIVGDKTGLVKSTVSNVRVIKEEINNYEDLRKHKKSIKDILNINKR